MKTLKLNISVFLTLAAIILFISACQKNTVIGELSDTPFSADKAAIEALANNETELLKLPELQMADDQLEYAILNDGYPEDLNNWDAAKINHGPGHPPFRLFHCLDTLNLTQTQKDSVHAAMIDRKQCAIQLMMQIRQINHQIMMHFNQQRHQLLQQFSNGQITQQQLMQGLYQLFQQLQYAMQNHPQKQQLLQQLHQCNVTFFTALQTYFTPQQWLLFKDCMGIQ